MYVGVLSAFTYLGVWLLSLCFRPFVHVRAVLINVPWLATLAWTLVGLCLPFVSVGLAWAWGDYSVRDEGTLFEVIHAHSARWSGTWALAFYEEVLDRALVLQLMLAISSKWRRGAAMAVVLSAVVFAFGHSDLSVFRFARLFAFGCMTALLCIHYQSVFPGFGLHAAINSSFHLLHGSSALGGVLLIGDGAHQALEMAICLLIVALLLRRPSPINGDGPTVMINSINQQ